MLELINIYRADLQHIASVLLALAIWRWGGGPERWLIGIFIGTMVLPIYASGLLGLGGPIEGAFAWLFLVLDLLAAAGFVIVAINANRIYPLWIAGFQLVAICAHMIKGMVDGVSPLAIAILVIGPSYFQLLLIFVGFLRHRRREQRFGPYRDWRIARPDAPAFPT
ncbi:MAG: hypothetical protein NXH71_13275 [Erythrobacteraceae bacterium]|jgi:hypothetical protein|nr:hypothetical protein [Erythrobacteraceae bacterium]